MPRPVKDDGLETPAVRVPVAIYTRVSTMHQIGGRFTSCESQEAICREHIRRNADLGWYEVASHSDPAYSGSTMKRPGMEALKHQIAAGEVKIVILFMLERVLRDTDEWSAFRKFLQMHDCTLESPTGDISEAEPEGRLKNNIVMSVAEYARLSTAKKVRIKMLEQAKRGIWNGGWLPYGYAYDKNTKALLPDPKEAPVVRRVFEQAAGLVSLQDIANALNAEGLRTRKRPLRRRDGSVDFVGGNLFRDDGLRLIIRNPIYRGVVRFKNQEFASTHDALVSRDIWERANAAVVVEKDTARVVRMMVDRDAHMHILKGVVYCASCDRTLVPHDSGKKGADGKPYRYYYCGFVVKERQRDRCTIGQLQADALEKVTLEFLGQLSRHPDLVALVIQNARSRRKADRPVLHRELDALLKEMSSVKQKQSNCADVLVNGGVEIMTDSLKQRMVELDAERQRLTVAIERKRHEVTSCDTAILNEERVVAALSRLGTLLPQVSPSEQKELCRLLIDRMEVSRAVPVSPGNRNVVNLRMKLHLPRLVQGMEERVGGGAPANRGAAPVSARSANFDAQVDFTNAARGEVAIVAPFRQLMRVRFSKRPIVPCTDPKNTLRVRHPIHDVLRWQSKLDSGEYRNRADLARKLGVSRAAVTKVLRMLELIPEIREFLATLTTPADVRHFSVRRMSELAAMSAPNQKGAFTRLCKSYGAGMRG